VKASSLSEYARKRDFRQTAEPRPGPADPAALADDSFVIQKHAASRLHYDLRLEIGGVLKSWAVPKGIPLRNGEKHLAVQVEDHPLDYAGFEGVIPAGNYGGGTVMVWDFGRYFLMGGEPRTAWEAGMLHLGFDGRKLRGEWTLVRTKSSDEKAQWLLLKTGGDLEDFDEADADKSAVSGRTMEEIAEAKDAQWTSSRPAKNAASVPAYIAPMKPLLVTALPKPAADWLYEIKFDGYRALALKGGAGAELRSASDKPLTFPEVAEAVAALPCASAIIDGEVVALDAQGRPSFQLLQNLADSSDPPPLCYYVFDLLELDKRDLRGLPAIERKALLAKLLEGAAPSLIRLSASLEGAPDRLVEEVRRVGLEGLVAKRRDSVYEAGRRSPNWQKFRILNEQEFVIGGYTAPGGTRTHFGALLVGYYREGKLIFAAKVGTGFTEALLEKLHRQFQPMRREGCPFVNLPDSSAGRWSSGITASKMRTCVWLKPDLICQVRFAEWTREGGLRQPVFLGLRDDKPASAVVRETPLEPGAAKEAVSSATSGEGKAPARKGPPASRRAPKPRPKESSSPRRARSSPSRPPRPR
jgi:bifunctional non-homologous end joining protein LigD